MADFSGQEVDLVEILEGWTAAQLIAGGLTGPDSLRLVGVAQYSMNSVDVGFSFPVSFFDPYATTDGANRANYSFTAPDGAPLVQTVELVGPGVVRVFADAPFVEGREYTLNVSSVILSSDGFPFVAPFGGTFSAFGRGVAASAFDVGEVRTDVQNVADEDGLSGSLAYDATGDLANESGTAYLRKRIVRRLTTAAGQFFHLPGYGVAPKLKATLRSSKVREIEKRAEAQVLREPDVRAAKVSATVRNLSILVLSAKVTQVDGTLIRVSAAIETEN